VNTGLGEGGLEQFCFQAVPERRQWLDSLQRGRRRVPDACGSHRKRSVAKCGTTGRELALQRTDVRTSVYSYINLPICRPRHWDSLHWLCVCACC